MKYVEKDIPGYEGLYVVSNTGIVRSLDRVVLRKGVKVKLAGKEVSHKGTYICSHLSKNGKVKIYGNHVLVAMAFLGFKPSGRSTVIDHIDNNPHNNNLDNLQILTQSDNVYKYSKTGLPKLIFKRSNGTFMAAVNINGKRVSAGCFKTVDEALEAQKLALLNNKVDNDKPKGGYYVAKSNKWIGTCHVNGKRKYLGSFNTEEEMTKAYNDYLISITNI